MHCPKCGFQIDSDDVSFCSRCGQTLELVRAALMTGSSEPTAFIPKRRGINLGVTLMFFAGIPAMAAILSTNVTLPVAFLLLVIGYIAILLGSGPLMKAFRTDVTGVIDAARRELRRDIAFGSTLMFLGIILATCLVAAVPGRLERIAFISFWSAMFIALLSSSKWIESSLREIVGGDQRKLPAASFSDEIDRLDATSPAELLMPARVDTSDLHPPSVTEATTNLLRNVDSN